MPCCGEKRRQIAQASSLSRATKPLQGLSTANREPSPWRPAVYFEYVGKTGMTVFGPVTSKRYRFNGNGTVVAVDVRDAPSLRTVPRLKELSGPEAE